VQTKNEYDFYTKRLWKVHEDYIGLNYVTEYGYDEVGNLRTVKNARGYTSTYTYNAADQLTRADYPGSTYETWTYRDDGRVYTHTDARGRQTVYRYDADDRLWGPAGSGYVAINYPNDADVNISRDQDGLVTSFTAPGGASPTIPVGGLRRPPTLGPVAGQ
jgi:YD repeat-containing protein